MGKSLVSCFFETQCIIPYNTKHTCAGGPSCTERHQWAEVSGRRCSDVTTHQLFVKVRQQLISKATDADRLLALDASTSTTPTTGHLLVLGRRLHRCKQTF